MYFYSKMQDMAFCVLYSAFVTSRTELLEAAQLCGIYSSRCSLVWRHSYSWPGEDLDWFRLETVVCTIVLAEGVLTMMSMNTVQPPKAAEASH